jgi:hypothetical protein
MKARSASWFSLFYIFFFAAVIIGAFGYTTKARLIPLVVAIPCLVFSMAQFILDLTKSGKKGRSIEDDLFHGVMEKMIHQEVVAEEGKEQKKEKKQGEKTKPFFAMVAWLMFFYILVFFFGFLITIPVFTVLFMRSRGERWLLSLGCAAAFWLSIWLSFSVGARMALYEGYVFRLFGAE